jgi:predicted ABC-type ATPase
MIVIAGPSGSGKSKSFPVDEQGCEAWMNTDHRCRELNHGSSLNIPPEVRQQANRETEEFIERNIREGRSFAVETTLRVTIAFSQTRQAREAGGHAAPPEWIQSTYRQSLAHLPQAIREFDNVCVYDNSKFGEHPRMVFQTNDREVTYIASRPDTPEWLERTLQGTEYELSFAFRDQVADRHPDPDLDLSR